MIRQLLKKSLFLRQVVRNYRLMTLQPRWDIILQKDNSLWNTAISSQKHQRVLVATSVGAFLSGTTLESLLAVALTLRNIEVHILLCDKVLSACMECMLGLNISEKQLAKFGPQKYLCNTCFYYANKMYKSLGLKVHYYSNFLTDKDIKNADEISQKIEYSKIRDFVYDGLKVGEHAMAGALRFYAKGEIGNDESYGEIVLKRYLNSAMLTVFMINNLLKKYQYDCAVFHHGIYVPQGLIGEVCRKKGVRVVNWNPAYRKQCFIFSHKDTYHHTLMSEPTEKWENIPWNIKMQEKLLDYLKSRWYGTKDWIWFHDEKPQFDVDSFAKQVGIDFSKPCIGMLTNVIWDAQLHYPTNIFSNMLEWLFETISYFEKRKDLQLIIRVHPAEIRGTIPARQPVVKEIQKRFSQLSQNIFVVPPENPVSTYPLMEKCNTVIIYGTKTGVELTCMGIPVIVAGEAWIRNKGLTIDPKTKAEYFQVLDKLPLSDKMNKEQILRAYKYAYHFFFRRMIENDFIKDTKSKLRGSNYKLNINSIRDILPSNNKKIDLVCSGILNTTDFIFPYEYEEQ